MAQPQRSACQKLGERGIQGFPACLADAQTAMALRRLMALHGMHMCGLETRSPIGMWRMYELHHLRECLRSLMPCALAQALLHPYRRAAV